MGKRKKKALPRWAQATLVWFVLSTLLAFGVLYLRAEEKLSDRVFQPLAMVLCGSNDRLATNYKMVDQAPRRELGDSRRVPQQPIWSLRAAECVDLSGARRPAPGFLPLVWLTMAAVVGCLLFLSRFGRRADP